MELKIKLNEELTALLKKGYINSYKLVKFVCENTNAVNTTNKELQETALKDLLVDNKKIIDATIDSCTYELILILEEIEVICNDKIKTLLNDSEKCTINKLATATKDSNDYNFMIDYYKNKIVQYVELGTATNTDSRINVFQEAYNSLTYIKCINRVKSKSKLINKSDYNYFCEVLRNSNYNYSDEYLNSLILEVGVIC